MPLRLLFIICSILATAASAQVPQLSVVSATSKQVQLIWTATPGGSYSIFRVPTVVINSGIPGSSLNASMAAPSTPIVTVNTTSWTDSSFDPSATYTYFLGVPNNQFSNKVMVGPPPLGFNIVVPSTEDTVENAGVLERMDLDKNGDPGMAYMVIDPNGDGDESDDTLYFISWNRAAYVWNKPVAVAVTGPVFREGPTVPLSLTRDAATDTLGLAYTMTTPDGFSTIMLATSSDAGVSWKSQSISGVPHQGVLYKPSLALWNGAFYAVFLTDNSFFANASPFPEGNGFLYVTGNLVDVPAKWTSQPVPFPAGYSWSYYTVSLALDSNHVPGIAFNVANDTYEGVAFWRPGMAFSTLVAHNDGYTTNDNPAISLTFFGTQARIATDAEWNYASYDPDSEPAAVWVMRALDSSGTGWSTPLNVTSDNANVLDSPWITTGSQGQTAIAMASNHDPEGVGMLYGFPKIARSADFLMFQTCGPALADSPSFAPHDAHPVLRFGANDKLWLAFNNDDSNGDIGIGLVLWREQ